MYWRILDAFESPLYLLRCASRDNVIRIDYSIEDSYSPVKALPFSERAYGESNYVETPGAPPLRPKYRVQVRFSDCKDFNDSDIIDELRLIFLLFRPYAEYYVSGGSIKEGRNRIEYKSSTFKGYFENILWSLADRACPMLFKDSWLSLAFRPDIPVVLSSSIVCHGHWKKDCPLCSPIPGMTFKFNVSPLTQFYQLVAKLHSGNKRFREVLNSHKALVNEVRARAQESGDPRDLVFPSVVVIKSLDPFVGLIESLRLSFWGTLPSDENKFILGWADATFYWAEFARDYWGIGALGTSLLEIDDVMVRKYYKLLVMKDVHRVGGDQIERTIAGAFRPEILFNGRPMYSFSYSNPEWRTVGGTMTFQFGFSHPLAYFRVNDRSYRITQDPFTVPATSNFSLMHRSSGLLIGTGIEGGVYPVSEVFVKGLYHEHRISSLRLSHLNCLTCHVQVGLETIPEVALHHRNHRMTCDFGKFTLHHSLGKGMTNKNSIRSLFYQNMGDAHPRDSYPYLNRSRIRMNCKTCGNDSVTVRSYSDGVKHLGHTLSSVFGKEFVLTRSMLRDPGRLLCINRYGMSFYGNLKFSVDIMPPSVPLARGRSKGPPIPLYLKGWA